MVSVEACFKGCKLVKVTRKGLQQQHALCVLLPALLLVCCCCCCRWRASGCLTRWQCHLQGPAAAGRAAPAPAPLTAGPAACSTSRGSAAAASQAQQQQQQVACLRLLPLALLLRGRLPPAAAWRLGPQGALKVRRQLATLHAALLTPPACMLGVSPASAAACVHVERQQKRFTAVRA
jgi:hypothetical protein